MNFFKKYFFIFGYLGFFLTGLLFFCFYNKWIIVYFNKPCVKTNRAENISKTSIVFFFWKDDAWLQQKNIVHYKNNNKAQLEALVNAWLSLAYDQQLIPKKTTLENFIIDPSGKEGYLSFSNTIFDTEQTTQEQHMLVESILKTIKPYAKTCTSFMFLVNHKPLANTSLDFSLPWPAEGFL